MHLYLGESPRTLYVVTSSQEEALGRPRRALVFRAADGKPSQAVVEFLPKDEVDLSNTVKLTTRIVKGCLGLISISGGKLAFCSALEQSVDTSLRQTSFWQSLPPPQR